MLHFSGSFSWCFLAVEKRVLSVVVSHIIIFFFLRDFIFKKTLFEKLQYLKHHLYMILIVQFNEPMPICFIPCLLWGGGALDANCSPVLPLVCNPISIAINYLIININCFPHYYEYDNLKTPLRALYLLCNFSTMFAPLLYINGFVFSVTMTYGSYLAVRSGSVCERSVLSGNTPSWCYLLVWLDSITATVCAPSDVSLSYFDCLVY